ncbi:hypothetical protein ACFWY5_42565, partial [Nonomuraea sp. NPDC059007]|uniref:hypothetical protein n=1 Tax=Nonomuraea sp. NPDC059007 TaxID=3346692 RepID=UPI0036B94D82
CFLCFKSTGAYTFVTSSNIRAALVAAGATTALYNGVVDRRAGGRLRRNLRFDRIYPEKSA